MAVLRVLVTGSSGLLGAAVVERLLRAGHEVTGLDPAPPPAGHRHHHVSDDLSDLSRLKALLGDLRPNYVIHSGGISGPMVLADRPAEIMAINVAGSLNLIRASAEAGMTGFVYCSSISAIGDVVGDLLPDDPPMWPTSAYGASKAAVDNMLRGLHGRMEMWFRSLRFTTVYGPGRQTIVPVQALVNAALASDPAPVPVPEDLPCPYIYVEDGAAAAVAAIQAPPRAGLFYNIAHPELVTLREAADHLAALGRPVELRVDPALPIVRRGALDVSAAARDFGFTAAIDMKEGLTRIVAKAG